MLRPAEPRGERLLIGGSLRFWDEPIKFRSLPAEVLFDILAHQLLFPVELITDIINGASVPVVPVLCDGENLPVALDLQFKFLLDIPAYMFESAAQNLLAVVQEGYVVRIFGTPDYGFALKPEFLLDYIWQPLVHPVHKVAQTEVCEVLAQVVPDRKPR